MKRAKKAGIITAVSIVGLLISAALISFLLSAYGLTVTHYELADAKLSRPVRAVLLADLHDSEFGRGNSRLIAAVREQEPDLILVAGDLVDQRDESTDIAVSLLKELSGIAPTYVSFGNHELAHEEAYESDLRKAFTDAGATVLDREWADIDVNGQAVRIGGIYGYCMPERYANEKPQWKTDSDFLKAMADTGSPVILMCHMPYSWQERGSLEEWDIDAVLCGHSHGGQARLPFIGGLWAPDRGWFPGRECGLYYSKNGERAMLLTRGLGSSGRIPRFNNIPEIAVLDIVPKADG